MSDNSSETPKTLPPWKVRRPPNESEFTGAFVGGGERASADEMENIEKNEEELQKSVREWIKKRRERREKQSA